MTREDFWCQVFLRVVDRTHETVAYSDALEWADIAVCDFDKRFGPETIQDDPAEISP